ncbi:MAG: glycosyltransferase [Flavobacteriales bacterium]|nr:glycosyltransferase [Flavobacteriales bacterium]|tara:strand:- start:5671 stop:6624 length:954 start_codon:yes stop_codon:yes gene_type:complete
MPKLQLSICIPLFNEVESIQELHAWILKVMEENSFNYEILFVDDGSTDGSWNVIQTLSEKFPNVKGIKFRRNYGKSAGLFVAFKIAKGDVVITMDSDLQDSPEEIPALYRMITEENYQLVSGYKEKRFDPLSKTIPTKLFNLATRMMSGINLKDFNCGLKAYDRKVVKSIEVYGEMHRYIPVLAKWAGFHRIGEKVVLHQERKYGVTKFGLERFVNGFLDLLTVMFMSKFGKKPMHLFGLLGVLFFVIGFGIAAYLVFAKIFWQMFNMTDRPLFFFCILSMIVGVQLFMTGFIAELVGRSNTERNNYDIEDQLNSDF